MKPTGLVFLRLRFLLAVIALPALGVVREGEVRTLSGTTLKGTVEFTPAGLSITPPGTNALQVPLDQLASLTLAEAPGATASATNTPASTNIVVAPASVSTNTAAAAGWNAAPIGPASPGKLGRGPEGWTVSGAGAGLRGNADSFFLMERRIDVAGQLTGALTAFQGTNSEAMAGLILRDNLGESAAYAFLGQRANTGICFQYRQIASGMTMRVTNAVMPFPAWLKLSRMGGAVVAETSIDGRQWQPFGRANVNLGRNSRAGLAVASGTDDTPVTARFSEPTVGAAGLGYAPATGYPRIVLRGGSILVGPVESADESVIRLGGSFAGSMVSLLNVGRIEFMPATPELQNRLQPDRPGLVLSDGDFIDGKVRGIATNVVTMNSLLYGFRRFVAGGEAAILQVGRLDLEDALFRVRLRNGSELRARVIEGGQDTLRAESPLLGRLVIRADEIESVNRTRREK